MLKKKDIINLRTMVTGAKIYILAVLIIVVSGLAACFFQASPPSANSPSATGPISSNPVASNTITSSPATVIPPVNRIDSGSPPASTPSTSTPATIAPLLRTPVISDPIISELPVDYYSDSTITDHNYFYPAKASMAGIKTDINLINRPPIQVRYISKQQINQDNSDPFKISYNFETIDSNAKVSFLAPSENDPGIKFTPGMTYRILAESMPPVAHGLIISQGSEIVYAQIMDFRFDGLIGIDNGFWPLSVPSFNVKQGRLLKDHYREINNDSEYTTMTNLEIEFSLGEKRFILHQGQSASLGDYKIDLTLADAIETQLKGVVMDGGSNGFSFTFSRLIESQPISIKSPGDEKVFFIDPALDIAIRDSMEIYDRDFSRMDLVGLFKLDAATRGIINLSGLENCGSLWGIDLKHNKIEDLSPLSNLSGVNYLFLDSNNISDLSSLQLANLKSLTLLSLNNNQIVDISDLSKSTILYNLEMARNKIVDISPLSNLSKLDNLDLSYNRISDITVLASLNKLYGLNLSFNKITNISALSKLPVFDLDLRGNSISDISPLVENPNLVRRTKIKLAGNPLSENSINKYIPQLKERGIEVNY